MTGILYVVATPIGNLKDITFRAVEILKSVNLIIAEDTRVTRKLLIHYDIKTPLDNYHQHSSQNKMYDILRRLISGESIALVTDAGTPGISDPGNELIFFLLQQEPNISVKSIPGASSLSAILSICAFNMNSHIFLGFMPKKGQSKLFDKLEKIKLPFVYFESPHRLIKNLEAIKNYFGSDTEVFIGRELTKMHEETFRGNISEVLENLGKSNLKGEVVVVVNLK